MSLSSNERTELSLLKLAHSSQAVSLALISLGMALDRWLDHAFNPNQPRVPAGHPDGGQWTDGDDADTPIINDPPIEEVYPELLILPLLRIPRILNAWRLWALNRRESREWSLSRYKSPKRWANQLQNRKWTPEEISETIKHGKRDKAPNLPRKNDPTATATRYEYDGRFVVRDDQTGEILQISDKDFIPREFP